MSNNEERAREFNAKMLADSVSAIIHHMEDAPGGQTYDDASKAAILKAAANVYEMKYQREMVIATIAKGLNSV